MHTWTPHEVDGHPNRQADIQRMDRHPYVQMEAPTGRRRLPWTDKQPQKWTPRKMDRHRNSQRCPDVQPDTWKDRRTPRGWDAPGTDRDPRGVHLMTDRRTTRQRLPPRGTDGRTPDGRTDPREMLRQRPAPSEAATEQDRRTPQHPEGGGSDSGAGKGGTRVGSEGGEGRGGGAPGLGLPGGEMWPRVRPLALCGALNPGTPTLLGSPSSWDTVPAYTSSWDPPPPPLRSLFTLLDSPAILRTLLRNPLLLNPSPVLLDHHTLRGPPTSSSWTCSGIPILLGPSWDPSTLMTLYPILLGPPFSRTTHPSQDHPPRQCHLWAIPPGGPRPLPPCQGMGQLWGSGGVEPVLGRGDYTGCEDYIGSCSGWAVWGWG